MQARQHRGPGQEVSPGIFVAGPKLQKRREVRSLEVTRQIALGKAVAAVGQHAAQDPAIAKFDLRLRPGLFACEIVLAAVR